jgi:nucleotide-binding universal stress UspA family protein
MSSKRRSYEKGHRRKYLVVIDDTSECDRAVYWAARRAGRTKSAVVMLRVIEPGDRNQQWLGVADLMQAEQLGAGTSADDPGPLVSNVAKFAGTFPIPLAIVPGHLSDEDIDASS